MGGVVLCVASADQIYNAYETLVDKVYAYCLNNARRDIVFDIGMNIGDATLFFLKNKNIDKVYGYEPFMETFLLAKKNIEECGAEKERCEIFPYGLSGVNEKRNIEFNPAMTCGMSTDAQMNEYAASYYHSCGLLNAEYNSLEEIEVKKASEVLREAMETYPNHNYILKMDCEGEEYGIVEDLYKAEILGRFHMIMLEWHYGGSERIMQYLEKVGFSYWCFEKGNNLGLIYANKC